MDQELMFLTAAIAASVALGAPAVKAADLPTPLDARVHAIAEQGPEALRRFISRTRMIYGLDFHDYAIADWYQPLVAAGPDGDWAGVQWGESDPGAWLEAANFAADEPAAAKD